MFGTQFTRGVCHSAANRGRSANDEDDEDDGESEEEDDEDDGDSEEEFIGDEQEDIRKARLIPCTSQSGHGIVVLLTPHLPPRP